MKTVKRIGAVLVIGFGLLSPLAGVRADGIETNLVDPAYITTGVKTPANNAMGLAIGFSATATVFGYVAWAVRKKRG